MISEATRRLAAMLSDGEYRSGQALAERLGCTRAAVWKQVGALRALGLEVDAMAGRGYRLAMPLELLDREAILAAAGGGAAGLAGVEVVADIDSTNAELLRRPPGARHGVALLAERQSGGRGRRGRAWHSPFGRNVYLSLGWRFHESLRDLTCLPLVVAVAAARAVRAELSGNARANAATGVDSVGVKWPNDLVLDGRKLGGGLVEIQGDMNGPCDAVMGVGINVCMHGDAGAAVIDQAWTDLASDGSPVSRNRVAGRLLDALADAAEAFADGGFAPFRDDWAAFDVLAGRAVTLYRESGEVRGIAAGVGERGGLLVEAAGLTREYLAGEVTLHAAG